MYGKITLIGRLGNDPEMRYTQGGTAVTNFSLAVDQGFGENKKTLWVRVACWGRKDGEGGMAETAANYLHKGSKVFVEGEPSVRAYMQNDEARASLEVNARELRFLDPKPDSGNGNGHSQQQQRPAAQSAPAAQETVSPDGNYVWDAAANAWKPRNAPPPPPPPPGADAARDVDPDDIPF